MKKLMCFILAFAMAFGLTGCMYETAQVNIKENGSGSVKLTVGIEKSLYDSMSESEVQEASEDKAVKDFTINGVTYRGYDETVTFASVEEFNEIFNEQAEDSVQSYTETPTILLEQNVDKSYNLTFATVYDTEEADDNLVSMSIDEETAEKLKSSMVVKFDFTFPTDVTQVQGSSSGITISGKTLSIDFMNLANKNENYKFTTSTTTETASAIKFTDVKSSYWGAAAINAMAEGGLVVGVGNNKFNPEGTLTIGEFCTILARAQGYETGNAHDHWAGKAVEECAKNGLILVQGYIDKDFCNKKVTREVAVSAMYLAKQDSLSTTTSKGLTAANIPDYKKISTEYRDNIVNAYNYGITNGNDSARTFNPQGILTRAQVCQLFYNLDWTTAK